MVSAYNTDMFSFPMDEFTSWMLVILAQISRTVFQDRFEDLPKCCSNELQMGMVSLTQTAFHVSCFPELPRPESAIAF